MKIRQRTFFLLAAALGLCQMGAGAPGALPKGGVWSLAGAMPEPRQEAGIAAFGNMLYVIGGYGTDQIPSTLVQVYDAAAKQWKQLAPMPPPRHAIGAGVVGNRIYLPGGSIVQGGRAPGTTPIMDTFEPN